MTRRLHHLTHRDSLQFPRESEIQFYQSTTPLVHPTLQGDTRPAERRIVPPSVLAWELAHCPAFTRRTLAQRIADQRAEYVPMAQRTKGWITEPTHGRGAWTEWHERDRASTDRFQRLKLLG
eukprot:TRINITY_DN45102_c0_g1_i2.p1 TRINITY_DN45102_c0_g1~~TRINITY_DN45102_c0_g1_i2.p1  ORF type:complete len:122 (-),score=8.10 TRINITY_DN45102_c0_g1_i2:181-546(-)